MGTSWAPICPVRRQVTQETVHASLGDKCALVLSAGQNREPLPGITRLIRSWKKDETTYPKAKETGRYLLPRVES